MAGVTSFRIPDRVLVGGGARRRTGEVVAEFGVERPLIVTDRFLAGNGTAEEVAHALRSAGLAPTVWDGTVPDPTASSVEASVEAARAHGADSIIGLGGGSPMDTAKATAMLLARGGAMRDYKAPVVSTGHVLPVVAIPTTAGSGSEATQFTIITDDANHEKMLCAGPAFLPRAAIVDFELTMSMPARLTADTGVDALTHAIEAYVSRKANPLSDTFALRAIRLVGEHLVTAYRDGSNAAAREAMMLASLQAGIAFSNASVALVHGMSRPIGAHFGIAHGLSNALLFAEVTRFSLPGAVSRYADCARALGAAPADSDDETASRALVEALERLVADVAVPHILDLGVDPGTWAASLDEMASQALASGSPANNPVVPDHGQIVAIYERIAAR